MLRIERLQKVYLRRWTRRSLAKSLLNLNFRTRVTPVFSDISFTVGAGEILGLSGANGSGKSTLLRIIADVLAPTGGAITRPARIVSLLASWAYLHPNLEVHENIRNAAVFSGVSNPGGGDVISGIAREAGLADRLEDPASTLSYGMRNRLFLAAGLAAEADLYLIDELFDPLDEEFRRSLLRRLRERIGRGAAAIITSHDTAFLEAASDRILSLPAPALTIPARA